VRSYGEFYRPHLRCNKEYNKYRSPEAKPAEISRKELCWMLKEVSAKLAEYMIEDFIYELQKLVDVKIKIASFKERGPETIRVKYNIENEV
jgi:hypothetical protein